MPRKFAPYDPRVIKRELSELSSDDFRDLTFAMKNYQEETGIGYTVSDYGEVLMIKGRRQGRGLFFAPIEDRFILLKVYKKESRKAPKHIIEAAIARKRKFLENDA